MLACGDGGKTNPRASLAVLHCALVQSSWIVLYLHRPRVTHGDSQQISNIPAIAVSCIETRKVNTRKIRKEAITITINAIKMSPPTIIVFGSLNMDLIAVTPRLPRSGETLPFTSFTTHPGGKGANQAVAIARLSHSQTPAVHPTVTTRLLGTVGTDTFAPGLVSALVSSYVDTTLLRTTAGSSGVAIIIVEQNQGENRILFNAGANASIAPADISDEFFVCNPCAAVVLQCEIPLPVVLRVLELASAAGVITVFNPAPTPADGLPEDCYKWIDWVVVNETEAAMLGGSSLTADESDGGNNIEWVKRVAKVLKGRGAKNVVITLGSRGSFWLGDEGGVDGFVLPSEVGKNGVVDTTGAGDTFVGALVLGLVEGKTKEQAMRWAGRAAGVSVGQSGAMNAIPWRDQVMKL